jgi:hypothetical protein
MVGTHAGDMIGEIARAIEMGADAADIGKTIHANPKLGQSGGITSSLSIESVGARLICDQIRPRKSSGQLSSGGRLIMTRC